MAAESARKFEALEAQAAALDVRFADPAFYKGPQHELAQLQAKRGELTREIAARYARWEELEAARAGG